MSRKHFLATSNNTETWKAEQHGDSGKEGFKAIVRSAAMAIPKRHCPLQIRYWKDLTLDILVWKCRSATVLGWNLSRKICKVMEIRGCGLHGSTTRC
jgi:hypothetical protein